MTCSIDGYPEIREDAFFDADAEEQVEEEKEEGEEEEDQETRKLRQERLS